MLIMITKGAANRSYYAVFHAIRSILALEGMDFKKHSGVIGYFREKYIKTGVFDVELSDIVGDLFEARGSSDYDDFYVISKERVEEQIKNAKHFVDVMDNYIQLKS